MNKEFYAHSKEGKPREEWHRLEDHLKKVAEMAREFANKFQAGDWGYLAGLWHDLGKFSREFQEKVLAKGGEDASIETIQGKVDHSSAGAHHAIEALPILGHLSSYAIAGHHSGLLNGRDTESCQEARLRKEVFPWQHGLQFLPKYNKIEAPALLKKAFAAKDAFSVAFFTRMVFSCLVDADFLDTEAFMNTDQAAFRGKWSDNIGPVPGQDPGPGLRKRSPS
ncbi:MAG: CRISPR-associated endonuclease Cas3'' [Syntrophaceae bacterium]|nr:CRISPR-associated endonuclease Cas3'' [Syntrophaceae bacterium]